MYRKKVEYIQKKDEIEATRNKHAVEASNSVSYRSIFRERLI